MKERKKGKEEKQDKERCRKIEIEKERNWQSKNENIGKRERGNERQSEKK